MHNHPSGQSSSIVHSGPGGSPLPFPLTPFPLTPLSPLPPGGGELDIVTVSVISPTVSFPELDS
ncbi:hypothetical protein ES703_111229 [subsurface metagenome]